MTRRSDQDAALEELYERIPKMMGCDGRCWISCGPVEMSGRERQRIKAEGYRIKSPREATMQAEVHWCEALTEDHRCAVYSIRPLICRIWGAVERMQCPYGCVPEGGWLDDKVALDMIAEAERIGGNGLPPTRNTEFFLKPESSGIELRMQYNLPPALRARERVFPCPECGFMLTATADATDPIGKCAHCGEMVKIPPI